MDDSTRLDSSSLLDLEQLQMLLEAGAGDSFDLLREIVGLFEEESHAKLAELKAGLVAGDYGSVGRAAHALAGSSANIGGRRVWQLARELEDCCRNGRGPDIPGRVQALEECFHRTLDALKAFLAPAATDS